MAKQKDPLASLARVIDAKAKSRNADTSVVLPEVDNRNAKAQDDNQGVDALMAAALAIGKINHGSSLEMPELPTPTTPNVSRETTPDLPTPTALKTREETVPDLPHVQLERAAGNIPTPDLPSVSTSRSRENPESPSLPSVQSTGRVQDDTIPALPGVQTQKSTQNDVSYILPSVQSTRRVLDEKVPALPDVQSLKSMQNDDPPSLPSVRPMGGQNEDIPPQLPSVNAGISRKDDSSPILPMAPSAPRYVTPEISFPEGLATAIDRKEEAKRQLAEEGKDLTKELLAAAPRIPSQTIQAKVEDEREVSPNLPAVTARPWEKIISFEKTTVNTGLDSADIADNQLRTASDIIFDNGVAEVGPGQVAMNVGDQLGGDRILGGVWRAYDKAANKQLIAFCAGVGYYWVDADGIPSGTHQHITWFGSGSNVTGLTTGVPFSFLNSHDTTLIANGYDDAMQYVPRTKVLQKLGIEPPRFYKKVAYFESDETVTQISATATTSQTVFRPEERTGNSKTSMKLTATAAATAAGYSQYSAAQDHSIFPNGQAMSNDDYLVVYIFHDIRAYVSSIELRFYKTAATPGSDFYTVTISPSELDPTYSRNNQWTKLLIKRSRFVMSGTAPWNSIRGFAAYMTSVTGTATIYVDNVHWKNCPIEATKYKKYLDNFEGPVSDWTASVDIDHLSNNMNVLYLKEGSKSLKWIPHDPEYIGKNLTTALDLTQYIDGITSQTSDEVCLRVYCSDTTKITGMTVYCMNETCHTLAFTGGGTHQILVGDTLTLQGGTATAVVGAISHTSGSWAGGDEAGTLTLLSQSGTFAAGTLNETAPGSQTDVCTIAGDSTAAPNSVTAGNGYKRVYTVAGNDFNQTGSGAWTDLRDKKLDFTNVGTPTGWNIIKRISIFCDELTTPTLYLDDFRLEENLLKKSIANMEVTEAWTLGTAGTGGHENGKDIHGDPNWTEGSSSYYLDVKKSETYTAQLAFAADIDLTVFGATEVSGNDDLICFWLKWENNFNTIKSIEIRLDCIDASTPTFATDYYKYEILPSEIMVWLNMTGEKETKLNYNSVFVELKKSSFIRIQSAGGSGQNWSDIVGVQFIVTGAEKGGATKVYFDHLYLRRASGLTGIYEFCAVFFTSDNVISAPSEWSNQITLSGTKALIKNIPLSVDLNAIGRMIFRKGGSLGPTARLDTTLWDNTTTQTEISIVDELTGRLLDADDIPNGTIRVPLGAKFCDKLFNNRAILFRDPSNLRRIYWSNPGFFYAWSELQALDFASEVTDVYVIGGILYVNTLNSMIQIQNDLGNITGQDLQERGHILPSMTPFGSCAVDDQRGIPSHDGFYLSAGYQHSRISDPVKNYFVGTAYTQSSIRSVYSQKHLYVSVITSGGTRPLLDCYVPEMAWRTSAYIANSFCVLDAPGDALQIYYGSTDGYIYPMNPGTYAAAPILESRDFMPSSPFEELVIRGVDIIAKSASASPGYLKCKFRVNQGNQFSGESAGSVTQANMKISAVDGTAFIDFTAASILTGNLAKYLVVTDSTGKQIKGWIKAAGTGETFGSEVHADANAASDPSANEANATTGWSTDGPPDTFESTNVGTPNVGSYHLHVVSSSGYKGFYRYNGGINQFGKLVKWTYDFKRVSGTSIKVQITDVTTGTIWGLKIYTSGTTYLSGETLYATLEDNTNPRTIIRLWNVAGEFYWDNDSLKQVLTPSTTGVTIVSTQGGTTYNWTSKESGFNYNDPAGYTYEILGDPIILTFPNFSAVVFSGSGLNDMTCNATELGTYNLTDPEFFTVRISTVAGTDKFDWTSDGRTWTIGVSCAATNTLEDHITISWAATTGHTLNDTWTFCPSHLKSTYSLHRQIIQGVQSYVKGNMIGLRIYGGVASKQWSIKAIRLFGEIQEISTLFETL